MCRALLWIAVSAITFGVFVPTVMATTSTECNRQNLQRALQDGRDGNEICLDGVGSGVASKTR